MLTLKKDDFEDELTISVKEHNFIKKKDCFSLLDFKSSPA